MKILLLALFVLQIVCHSSCLARLGEDEIQCEERYGFARKELVQTDKSNSLITGEGTVTRTYLYQGWRIRIGFLDGVAVREEYWKITGPGRTPLIADYEYPAILEGEKGMGSWQPKGVKLSTNVQQMVLEHLQHSLIGTYWIRSDGTATATMDAVKMHIAFESLVAIQRDEALKKANEQKQRGSVPAF